LVAAAQSGAAHAYRRVIIAVSLTAVVVWLVILAVRS
jgi:hypothetical protein